MSFFTDRFAERIGGPSFGTTAEIYKFEAIKRAKRSACFDHPDIPLIDLGVGESDRSAYPCAVETLSREAPFPENRYYADNGILEFAQAAARYMDRIFGVANLDPEREILHCIGSKSALALIPLAFVDPGDTVLATVPGYPILGVRSRYLGAAVHPLPLRPENGYLPDLDSLSRTAEGRAALERAKLLYLNYPNNPTGAAATESFFREVVDFARQHKIVVVHDAAYAALVYGGAKPLSFLSIPGAREVGLEIHSLSKSHNMTGWRLGFVSGAAEAVAAFGAVKDNSDAGQFRAIQKAGAAALDDDASVAASALRYDGRFDLLVPVLRAAGFEVRKPAGGFYCYAPSPVEARSGGKTVRFANAAAFSDWLVREHLVSTVPWDDVSPSVRFSVTWEASYGRDDRVIMADLASRLSQIEFVFGDRNGGSK